MDERLQFVARRLAGEPIAFTGTSAVPQSPQKRLAGGIEVASNPVSSRTSQGLSERFERRYCGCVYSASALGRNARRHRHLSRSSRSGSPYGR
jgi:hypothetical protein